MVSACDVCGVEHRVVWLQEVISVHAAWVLQNTPRAACSEIQEFPRYTSFRNIDASK